MATLDINGQHVTVDDSFLKLSPDEQQSTVDHIAASLSPKVDPVSANDVVRSAASGVPIIGGLLNKADAATNAGLSYALNPLFDEKDQLTGTIGERYGKSLATQEGTDAKFATQHPIIDTGAKLAGGVASMSPVVAAAPGLLGATGSFASRIGMGGLSNAAIGGTDSAIRGNGPVSGALIGGLTGAAAPIAEAALSPFASRISAMVNPTGYAERQAARGIAESGQTPQQLIQAVQDAAAAGQGGYTLADAMGNPGQRMLSAVARAPGEGRTNVVTALENRQAGQGERVGDILDQGLGTGNTARQTIDQLTESARRESAPLYREALDKQPVWNDRMQDFFNDPITAQGLREGVRVQRLESLATGQPFNPVDHAITGFNEAGDPIISGVPNMRTINLIKKGWDNQLEQYRDPTTGRLALDEYGRGLDQVRRAFLNEVDSVNPAYGRARAAYAGPAQVREAVGTGAQAATRGRATDNLTRFNALNPQAQQGFRGGYADTLAGNIERAAPGVNKVRPLLSDKAQTELDALSLHQGPVQPGQLNPLQQRLAREQTMFETRNQALGGSRTADNLADHEALGVNPTTVMHVASQNWGAALGSLLHAGVRGVTGNTPAVRKAVADILLQNGATLDAPALNAMVSRTIGQLQFIQQLARSGAGAAAVTTNANTNHPKRIIPIFVKGN
jgi:hypothetical protein